MKRSINEIQGMVLKAARGAGVPLGVGEDLSRAIPFFMENNALESIIHLIDNCCVEAQTAVDALHSGDEIALPHGVPASAVICLGAAQGLCVVETADGLKAVKDAPVLPARGAQTVPENIWARLESWAAKTYVPASEASRIAGAGAGLTDND